MGRPSVKPLVEYKGFLYQAASWKTARRGQYRGGTGSSLKSLARIARKPISHNTCRTEGLRTDPIGALIFSHIRDPHWLIADTQFTYTTTSDDGLRRGNSWNYDLAYLYRLLPRSGLGIPSVLLVLELNGEHVRRARLNGVQLPDTGGNLLFFSPGIEFIVSNRLVLEFSSPIPVGRDLNGSQIKPSSSFIIGFRWFRCGRRAGRPAYTLTWT